MRGEKKKKLKGRGDTSSVRKGNHDRSENERQEEDDTLCKTELSHALMTTQQEVMEGMIEDSQYISQPVIQSYSHSSQSVNQGTVQIASQRANL